MNDCIRDLHPFLPFYPLFFDFFALQLPDAAVAFRLVSEPAHAVVITSGTLAPMISFASELGTDFPVRCEARHVIDVHKQVR